MTEPQNQQQLPERQYRLNLWNLLLKHFNELEARELCFSLDLDYDDLGGRGRADNVRELIEYLARRERIVELIEVCREKRPFADWDDLLIIAQTNPEVFKTDAITSADSQRLGQGLAALSSLANMPLVRKEIFHFQDDFKEAREKIQIIRAFKQIHDAMQEVERCYVLLQDDRANLDEDEYAWDNVEINLLSFDDAFAEFEQAVIGLPPKIKPGPWYNMATKGQGVLHESLTTKALDKLDTGLRYVHRVLDRGMPRVNGRLVNAASELPFDDLIDAMKAVHNSLSNHTEVDTVMVQQFVQGIEALGLLSKSLEEHVSRHDDWQGFDDELRRIEVMVTEEDISELELSWPDVQDIGNRLYAEKQEQWAVSLRTISEKLETSLMNKPATIVLRQFQNYRSRSNRRFRQVDDELLNICQELQKVGEPLNVLLGTIQ